mmetsp:Transcript_25996/g.42483  ORF Transcript_25996/g.42483 Transcript_25996/m.42483 type:complete len:204 (+) Transcript_25996:590-1201(+)
MHLLLKLGHTLRQATKNLVLLLQQLPRLSAMLLSLLAHDMEFALQSPDLSGLRFERAPQLLLSPVCSIRHLLGLALPPVRCISGLAGLAESLSLLLQDLGEDVGVSVTSRAPASPVSLDLCSSSSLQPLRQELRFLSGHTRELVSHILNTALGVASCCNCFLQLPSLRHHLLACQRVDARNRLVVQILQCNPSMLQHAKGLRA